MSTIKQIAKIAGVSPSTVSNVLQGRTHKMSKETLERVRQTLNENNYVSNMSGRMLGRYGSKLIGVVMNFDRRDEVNAMQDPFLGGIIGDLEHEIRKAGYFMMLYISCNVEESLRMAVSWNVEGLIATGCNAGSCRKFMEQAQKLQIPIAFIDGYYYDDEFPFVNTGLQDWAGGYVMTRYLIQQGHRKIAFLADAREPIGVDYERLRGCKKAMENHGFFFASGDYVYLSYNARERRKILKTFMKERLRNYSVLFFASDYLASEGVNLFQDEGLQVPRDISVAGFDDNIFALTVRPRLTTIKQDISQKAYFAVQQALALIRKVPLEPEQRIIRLPVSLVIRDSVATVN
ncbi:MAG: LacI family transcriptional regulator [Treponema sp.]|jgi:LacI family transcriptional regulator|nr:LacI family transcriptional regulator [Treponema sp.]